MKLFWKLFWVQQFINSPSEQSLRHQVSGCTNLWMSNCNFAVWLSHKKQCVDFVGCYHLHHIVIFFALNYSHGLISLNIQMIQYFKKNKKSKIREKAKTLKTHFVYQDFFFFVSFLSHESSYQPSHLSTAPLEGPEP